MLKTFIDLFLMVLTTLYMTPLVLFSVLVHCLGSIVKHADDQIEAMLSKIKAKLKGKNENVE